MDPFLLERRYPEAPTGARDHRHSTERDRDRILHSGAFRRLQGKTQVFGIGQADFYRTRLTHSIETAQIARGIAANMLIEEPRLAACLTPELAEAAALAHDLGHPPFGHGGERILDDCMREVGRSAASATGGALRFEANAQTLHILVSVEPKSPDYPGLNLTRATLTGVVKYPYRQDAGMDKFIFDVDAEMASWALAGASSLLGAEDVRRRTNQRTSLTCQILDWADDCAYSIHDVEDALQAQFLHADDLKQPDFASRVMRRYDESREGDAAPVLSAQESGERLAALSVKIRPPRTGDERAHRKQALRNILNELITSVSVEFCDGPRGDFAWRLVVPAEQRITSTLCKAIVWEAVITDARVTVMIDRGKEVLRELFNVLFEEVAERNSHALFPRYYQPIIDACMGRGEVEAARAVCNFLALLTDMDALRLHASLRGRTWLTQSFTEF